MEIHDRIKALVAVQGSILFRPSAAERWLNCPGSVALSAAIPPGPSSQAAREGTAAHQVAEAALRGERDPEDWGDVLVNVEGTGFFVNKEMIDGVTLYVEGAANWRHAGTTEYVEHRLSLSALDPGDPLLEQVAGTADHLLVDSLHKRLVIRDLKYGRGVEVRGDSKQLRLYALMALMTFPGAWDEVVCEVTQPRLPDEDSRIKLVRYTPAELLDFVGFVYEAITVALGTNAPLKPDPSGGWCRWCPAASRCSALAQRAVLIAGDVFNASPLPQTTALTSMPPAPRTVVMPDPVKADVGELATWLEYEKQVDAFFQAVKSRVAQLIATGTTVPGWELIARAGNRHWKEDAALPEKLRTLGLKTVDMYTEPELKSPAQIEKLLPKDPRPQPEGWVPYKQRLAEFYERPMGSPTLAPATEHTRPPLPPVFSAAPVIEGVAIPPMASTEV
jgi:hypothetical protein